MGADGRTRAGCTERRTALQDPWLVRWGLIIAAVGVVGVLVIVPVINVFYEALARGAGTYIQNLLADPDTRHAIVLTLTVAPIAVVLNVVFGVAAAWAIARYQFPGRTILTTLIDLPFSVSPVVAGLIFVLLFGLQGYFGPWLRAHHLKIIFATPGLILVTAFVTCPFVARELIPVMQAVGTEEEIAALSLGASGWQLFWRVTVPNIRWGTSTFSMAAFTRDRHAWGSSKSRYQSTPMLRISRPWVTCVPMISRSSATAMGLRPSRLSSVMSNGLARSCISN
jgi:sulfate/thiosulfate transport system permease protein